MIFDVLIASRLMPSIRVYALDVYADDMTTNTTLKCSGNVEKMISQHYEYKVRMQDEMMIREALKLCLNDRVHMLHPASKTKPNA